MATRPTKIQKVADQHQHTASTSALPADLATADDENLPSKLADTSVGVTDPEHQGHAAAIAIGQELWHEQRRTWRGSASRPVRPPSRPVIRWAWTARSQSMCMLLTCSILFCVMLCSPDSTYDTLLLTSRPFAVKIPLAVSSQRNAQHSHV